MTITALKQLLDACFLAKRIAETLPELPEGMKPRHIHVLDAVHEIRLRGGGCRVGDVSARLNITTPSVTKLIQELEARHLLEKYADTSDKRVALLKLTPEGEACVQRYVLDFHGRWTQELADITDSQTMDAIHILERLQETMPGIASVSGRKEDSYGQNQ